MSAHFFQLLGHPLSPRFLPIDFQWSWCTSIASPVLKASQESPGPHQDFHGPQEVLPSWAFSLHQVNQWQGVHPESGNLRTLSPTAAGARVSVKKNMTPAHQVPTVHQASLNTGDQVTPWRPGQIGVLPAAFTDEETEALSKGLGFWAVETRAEFLQSGSIPALYYYVVNIPSPHVALVVKNLSANAGDLRDVGSTPESGRSLGEGHGSPLQYSCLENPMDRGVWRATVHRVSKSQTWMKWLSMHILHPKAVTFLKKEKRKEWDTQNSHLVERNGEHGRHTRSRHCLHAKGGGKEETLQGGK